MHLTGSLAVWDSVPTATGTAFQMLQLLVHREVGKISTRVRTVELVSSGHKLNAMHFDCSWTLSLVIVAARENEDEQLKCATSNLSIGAVPTLARALEQ